ncbi:MAG: hypothetical protein K2X37_08730 [Chitinophagaceae bacterium]|nr:hypothetical protein [Chitinophagaceae bacterium]
MKTVLLVVFSFFFNYSFGQNTKDSTNKEFNINIGVGFPYGGIGGGFELNPFSKGKGLFMTSAVGSAFYDGSATGYSLGLKYLLSKNKSKALIKTYVVLTYGTSSSVYITNSKDLSKTFTGFSTGFNFRFHVPVKGNFFRFMDNKPFYQRLSSQFWFLLPLQNKEVNDYRNYLLQNYNITAKKLSPVNFGVGVHYRLSK